MNINVGHKYKNWHNDYKNNMRDNWKISNKNIRKLWHKYRRIIPKRVTRIVTGSLVTGGTCHQRLPTWITSTQDTRKEYSRFATTLTNGKEGMANLASARIGTASTTVGIRTRNYDCYIAKECQYSIWFETTTTTQQPQQQLEQSRFYSSYPSREANGSSSNGARRGWHDNLQQHAALGFPLAKTVEPLVELFELSEADNNNINTINFRKAGGGSPTLFDRQRRAIHYLCECCYGLCLAPSDNISSNPGWEQALGYYGK